MKIINYFLIFTTTILLFSMIASAENGNIILSDDKILSYTNALVTVTPSSSSFTTIHIDNANYNYISSFHIKPSQATGFVHDFESTTFTITSGAIGGTGYAWYDKNTSSVYYSFAGDTLITASTIVINPAKDIFANITMDATNKYSTKVIDSTHPAALWSCYGSPCINIGEMPGDYGAVTVATRGTDTYSVLYLPNNLFTVSITKNPYISTKYFILGQNSEYSRESSFNKVSIDNATFTYNDGLYLNATMASGIYLKVLVNSSGTTGGSDAGTITTDKQTYIIGEAPVITWNIITPNPSYSYFLISTNPIGNTHTISSNIATSGSATDNYNFDVAGTWKESIIALNNSCTLATYYCWISGDILSTTVSVSSTQPALIANITANKTTYAYHEPWNLSVIVTGTNQYIIKAYDPNGQLFAGFPSPAVSGNQTILYTPITYTLGGTWTAKVYDIVNAQYVAQTTFIINPTQGGYYVGQIHILEGSINLSAQQYFTVAYTSNGTGIITIKKPDGSTYATYLSINGSGQDIITLSSSADVGYWSAVLVDQANIYTSQVYVSKGAGTTSANGSFTIFTDKTAYLRGDIVQATYRFPANYNNISIVVYDGNGVKLISSLRPAPEAQLFGYASITIGTSGTNGNWKLTLEDFNKTEYASAIFTVGNSPTTPGGGGSTANTAANLLLVFTYTAFYGMVIFIGIFYSAIKLMTAHGAQVNGSALVIVMALVATMEALVGLFDPFKLYIIVITWIFAAIYFRQTRTTATGES